MISNERSDNKIMLVIRRPLQHSQKNKNFEEGKEKRRSKIDISTISSNSKKDIHRRFEGDIFEDGEAFELGREVGKGISFRNEHLGKEKDAREEEIKEEVVANHALGNRFEGHDWLSFFESKFFCETLKSQNRTNQQKKKKFKKEWGSGNELNLSIYR